MRERRKPEILAPAGSMESLKAAVAAGCDAVYIGGSRFGARAYAQNPQEQDMLEAIRFCHLHGVKIYMTVNTLLKERELTGELYEYLLPYYQEGLDAVIVQDVGVMRCIHRLFPDLEQHASTQMTLTMGKSVKWLEEYGVSRIVPARELTLQELEQMRRDTDVELEVFVHGALCYCYSGQCLFSSMLGGRSGNRGRCAQPCRKSYQILSEMNNSAERRDKQNLEGYLLSLRENCNLKYVGELIKAGIDSFKIEGRMKRPEYTALTTAIYRKYVDLYYDLGDDRYRKYIQEHSEEWEEDMRRLGELYNRGGFTSGYLEGKSGDPSSIGTSKGDMLSVQRPNHGGILVGRVLSVDKHALVYRLERTLHSQDVVEFRDSRERTLYEYTLGEERQAGEKVTARYQKGCRILPGDKVYRTKDALLLAEIREKYLDREPKLGIRVSFWAAQDQNMKLEIWYSQEGEREMHLAVEGGVCQKAQKQAAVEQDVERLLRQTGGTPFELRGCQVQLEGGLFLPVGEVKKLRRRALDELKRKLEQRGCRSLKIEEGRNEKEKEREEKEREEREREGGQGQKKQEQKEKDQKEQSVQTCRIASVLTWEQFEVAVASQKTDEIYLKMEGMSREQLREAVGKGHAQGKKMYLVLPAIFRHGVYDGEKRKLKEPDNLYQMEQVQGFVIRNLESFTFLREEAGVDASRIIPDSNLYVTNGEAVDFWLEQGCRLLTIPLELTGREIEELLGSGSLGSDRFKRLSGSEGFQVMLYGHVPLMISAQCLRHNLLGCQKYKGQKKGSILTMQDDRQRQFFVFNACKYCYNVIYQGNPLVLEERKEFFQRLGICRFYYDFTVENREEVDRILRGKLPAGHEGHFEAGVD